MNNSPKELSLETWGEGNKRSISELTQWAALITSKFEVDSVKKIIYSKHPNRGRYYWKSGTMALTSVFPIVCLIHEISHHIHHARLLKMGYTHEDRKGHGNNHWHICSHHGLMFCEILWEVAGYLLGDPLLYPWSTEYKCIGRWAILKELEVKHTPKPITASQGDPLNTTTEG